MRYAVNNLRVIFLIIVTIALASSLVAADSTLILGKIYHSDSSYADANASVTCNGNIANTTSSSGDYALLFDGNQCAAGDNVDLFATDGVFFGTSSSTAIVCSGTMCPVGVSSLAVINAVMNQQIPGFGFSFVAPTAENDSIVGDSGIVYNASLTDIGVESVDSIHIYLYDSLGNFVAGALSDSVKNLYGSFSTASLDQGSYLMYAKAILTNGSVLYTENRTVIVDNSVYALFRDPTPENGSFFNMFNNHLVVDSYTNKPNQNFFIFLFNDSGLYNITDFTPNTEAIIDFGALPDGNYSFYSQVIENDSSNVTSKTRYFSVDATPPVLSLISVSVLDNTFFDGLNNSYDLVFNSTKLVRVGLSVIERNESGDAINSVHVSANQTDFLSPEYDNSSLSLTFNDVNIALNSTHSYSLYLFGMDKSGNVNSLEIKNFTIQTSNPNNPNNGGGGNGGSSGGGLPPVNWVNNTLNQSSNNSLKNLNLTNMSSNKPTSNNTSFGSRITGAVTGLLGKPLSLTVLIIFLIVLIVLYIYTRARLKNTIKSKSKEGKNGNK